jgi:hypothetical protein
LQVLMPENERPTKSEDIEALDEMDWLHPPKDVHDASGWNRYWKDQVNEEWAGFHDMFLREEWLARRMTARRFQTVLCAGNGVSLQPHALAYAGFKVTAADLSTWATEFMRDIRPESAHLKKLLYGGIIFHPIFYKSMPETWRRVGWLFGNLKKHVFNPAKGRGGTLEFLAGDLLDSGFCSGPFDVVIERCTVQLFCEAERREMLEKLTARMSPNGVFVSHCHMGWWRPGTPRKHLFEEWFRQHGFTISTWKAENIQKINSGTGRIAFLSVSTG